MPTATPEPSPTPTALPTSTPAPEPTPAAVPEVVDLPRWAGTICAALKAWSSYPGTNLGGDVSTMTIDERRERALGMSIASEAAAREAIVAITAVIPPDEAAAYHNALLAQVQAFAEFYLLERPLLAQATTAADFETTNAMLGLVTQETEAEVIASNALISDNARIALAACLGL